MTTITYPTNSTSPVVLSAIGAALTVLILAVAMAIAALSAPAVTNSAAPAEQTNEANSNDPTPNSGFLQYAN